MNVEEKKSLVFKAVNGAELLCRYDHRGAPLRPVLSIDFLDKENLSSLSIFLEAEEALALGELIGRLFSAGKQPVAR